MSGMVESESEIPSTTPTSKDVEYPFAYAQSPVQHLTWGIFEVAYETSSFGSEILSFDLFNIANLDKLWDPAQSTLRLLKGLFYQAPFPCLKYTAALFWLAIAPGLSVRFAHSILLLLPDGFSNSSFTIGYDARDILSFLVVLWLSSAVLSAIAARSLDEQKHVLGGHLRAHFLPLLVDASLRLDADATEDYNTRTTLPNPWAFGEETPGWDVVHELSIRVRNIITLTMECISLIHIIRRTPSPDAEALCGLGLFVIFLILFAPSNGAGGAGYTFWTKNEAYHRLLTLYSIIFDDVYRETRLKDGINEYLSAEYKRTSEALGVVKSNTLALACSLPPPWYWTFAQTVVVDYPMALYAFVICRSSSAQSLISIAVFQYGINTLSQGIYSMRGGHDPDSLLDLMKKAQNLFNLVDKGVTPKLGLSDPGNEPSKGGMKISFRDVSLCYGDRAGTTNALNSVSFDINPGELVVLVGPNGSGKSSLLKLMTGLVPPTEGEVSIDDHPIQECDAHKLRGDISFISQSDEIYPISLRENILMGLGNDGADSCYLDFRLRDAAQRGGSLQLLERLGDDTVLKPCRIVGQSVRGCGNGEIGGGALRELDKNDTIGREILISAGEKQRLIASRSIMRVQNRRIRLVILDEATSALDPIAERDLFKQFMKMKEDKTMILVTHRFGELVRQADQILCMDSGELVQCGTHEQLVLQDGKYQELYNAQALAFNSVPERPLSCYDG